MDCLVLGPARDEVSVNVEAQAGVCGRLHSVGWEVNKGRGWWKGSEDRGSAFAVLFGTERGEGLDEAKIVEGQLGCCLRNLQTVRLGIAPDVPDPPIRPPVPFLR